MYKKLLKIFYNVRVYNGFVFKMYCITKHVQKCYTKIRVTNFVRYIIFLFDVTIIFTKLASV